MEPGMGRARGRSRSRPGPLEPGQSPPREGEIESEDDSNGEAALRGRGGFRTLFPEKFGQLVTKPSNITTTVGSGGADINLIGNYFKIMTPKDLVVNHYHVDFEPIVESSRMRRGLLHSEAARFGEAYIFDGMSDLKTIADLESSNMVFTVTRTTDNATITITLKKVGTLGFGSYEMMRLYNTQMRRNLRHIGLDLIGRYYYEKQPVGTLPDYGGVQILRGFMTAINQHDGGILMVTDTIFKFVRNTTARDAMREHAGKSSDWRSAAKKEMVGSIVMTRYNNKTYRVDDIDFSSHPSDTFETRKGPVSYVEYYKTHYQLEIRDPQQPLLVCMPSDRDRRAGRDQPIRLVPELCNMTGLTDRMRQDYRFTKAMAATCKLPPEKRVQQLQNFMKKMKSNDSVKDEMSKWRIEYENEPIKLKGRVLGSERLLMHGETNQSGSLIEAGDFNRTMRGKRMPRPLNIERWVLMAADGEKALADELAETLHRVCGPMGIALGRPKLSRCENDRTASFVSALKAVPTAAQIVVCVVPNNNKERYDTIKKITCIEQPMASQVIIGRTLQKKGGMMTVATKVAIQMACKLGAEAWRLDIPPKRLMVIGYDTYHDSSQKGRSAGGFVCSTNDTLSSYYSRVSFHTSRQEMSSNFANNVAAGLQAYSDKNKTLPEKVVVYRDGVGEGMLRHVFEFEVKQVQDAIKRIARDAKVQLVFTIVTKRVNARFFAATGPNRYINPPPGTIIDNCVTRTSRYDFYLISQTVNEGTVSPTMFDILIDESGWGPQNHQKLAYKLTHLYYNWAGTVKVPAPCQYAHKLAFLSGQSLHREPATSLADCLFYL